MPSVFAPRTPLRLAVLAASLTTAWTAQAQNVGTAGVPAPTLAPITVIDRSNQGSMRPGALRDELVKTESISERAIAKAGATNVNEALDKNPGIAVQVECSICNVRNILLNNLPGRYTTLMIDGVPIFSSVSSAYGLDSVSVYGVERIDVARGAGASLIAPEALSGSVNIVTKRPTEAENRARAQIGSYGSRQGDAYLARPFEGGAITATLNYNKHDSVDADHNGISEYTGYDRRLGGIGFFLDDAGGFKVRGRLDVVNEKRGGGALGTDYSAIKHSTTGNPFDWRGGVHGSPDREGWVNPEDGSVMAYDDGRGGMSEIIFTDRVQFISTGEKRFGDSLLRLAVGAAEHKQDSFYELATYVARQKQYYAEASWQTPIAGWLTTLGTNFRYEDLRSHGSMEDGTPVRGVDDYTYRTPALFLQAYRSLFDDALEINGSVRYDRHNVFGGITSPRLNALWHHTERLSSRFSVGKGFRAPTSFFEQEHGILNTIRIDRQISKPEESLNASYALNYADDRLAVTGSYNYNHIKNFATLDPDQTDADGKPITVFGSAGQPVIVQGVDVTLSYLVTPALTVMAAAEGFNYRFPAGTLIFARPNAKAYLGLDYDRGDLDLNAKLVWTGPMNLRKFHDDGSGQQDRYNLDGTPKRDKSPGFFTLDVRGEYAINKHFTVYAGVDNVFDYKQSDKESPLFVNGDGGFDVTQLWGPSRGRYLYAGTKLSF
ncbi:TonB-dependent receptor [Achromobacter xylosoxidans]|uniref:TonB-dependent receptor plug domain-containing protein n=1 Tax=Alcaligenes xylosoxydans xylosoxydans TaxID=85698 RepID=UPI0012325639|nr:TonB-dependent receptor [Achromobacter xylosoxidans]KAA5924592.1 TonB-dependent receptor [Achromobacter xylosoxidans]MCZ8385080.1 TonB-dependent receptor [Achromobacter xylosoxidans]MEC6413166.1 TonB-dependent receptor [Achromobacter xylosoxidans]QKI72660.1 TonB-dependent receptor [Achromobacter xylosoxidans]